MSSTHTTIHKVNKTRGAVSNPSSRFESQSTQIIDDGWSDPEQIQQEKARVKTQTQWVSARTIISSNNSPDIPHALSINPYRGCEHGCVYCFARPTHSYLNLSPGLDFETRLFAKRDAATVLKRDLSKKNYQPQTISLGINTDAYQPIEKKYKITRSLLEVLLECRHPVSLLTKSTLIQRDIDILKEMAKLNLVHTALSITTLDPVLSKKLEPRAAHPQSRIETVRRLSEAGIPVSIMMAPIIPSLNDSEIETLLEEAAQAGALGAAYIILRLPHELKTVFTDWLQAHYPLRSEKIINKINALHGNKMYNAKFFQRQRGTGVYADLIQHRFSKAQKHCFNHVKQRQPLRKDLFKPPMEQSNTLF